MPAAAPLTDRRPLVIAIDGPASSGKSSVGAALARALGYRFLDTGLLYRALTWLALHRAVAPSDVPALVGLAGSVLLEPDATGRVERVLVDGHDVTDEVHAPDVDARVSEIARIPEVRAALLPRQRALAEGGGIVMAGRDIGTVVLPDADLKLYLRASAEERARRRAMERGLDPDGPEAAAILASLRRRDEIDSGREVAPLRAAPDAVVVVTDALEFDETVRRVVEIAEAAAQGQAEASGAVADAPGRPTLAAAPGPDR
jgi:CMP/dCMP kinase